MLRDRVVSIKQNVAFNPLLQDPLTSGKTDENENRPDSLGNGV
jgi:hypothetical protein